MAELELRHLRAVCAIADEGSLSKAAARLGLTQPALSAQLRSVERLVGGRLFDRAPTGSVPTALGREVVRTARVVLGDLGQLLFSTKERVAKPADAPLIAGVAPILWVGQLVDELRESFRCGAVRTEVAWSWQVLLDMLVSKRSDLAVFDYADGVEPRGFAGIELRTLLQEPQFVAISATSPLAEREEIELMELAELDWVTLPPDHDNARMSMYSACAVAGFTPRITHHVVETLTARMLVAAGGVALCAPASLGGDDIVIRPLVGDPISLRIMVATRADGVLGGRGREVFACAARAYLGVVNRNPRYARWWEEHPEAHVELDAAVDW
jgi:DNA-binding transcriptional LysR family regulator